MAKGIAIAGNIIVDLIKRVDGFPKRGNLEKIHSLSRSAGGCVVNTLIDLRRIDPGMNLLAIGCVGNDDNGRFACDVLRENNLDTDLVVFSETQPTSFSDVITEPDGFRTFFNLTGAGDELDFDMINAMDFDADIFHLGYALLLGGMDAPDEEYGTVMARTLAEVHRRGIKTSMDIVSSPCDRAQEIILASAKQCDYFIVNEVELEMASDIPVRNGDDSINEDNIKAACEKMFDHGVREWVIIHAPEGAWAMDSSRNFTACPSFNLPKGYIKGAVGAGDAFCAGALYGLYNNWEIGKTLAFGCGSAAACLSEANSIDGMRSREEIEKLMEELSG